MSADNNALCCANCGKDEESSGGGLKACTACKMVKYCNRECQISHRPSHKKACKKQAKLLQMSEGVMQNLSVKGVMQKLSAREAARNRTEDPLKNWSRPAPAECPICMIPLSVWRKPSGKLCVTCSQVICQGCIHDRMKSLLGPDAGRESDMDTVDKKLADALNTMHRCPFCR